MNRAREQLLRACLKGDLALATMCVSGGVDLHERSVDWNGLAPLHVASQFGWPELVRLLLGHGADVMQRTRDEELMEWAEIAEAEDTALHLAALEGHAEVCRALIEHGAEIDAVNRHGSTPMSNAIEANSVEIVTLLLRAGATLNPQIDAGVPPLHKAAIDGHLRVVRALLSGGAKPDAPDHIGRTALHYAVEHENALVCCELVASGASIDAAARDGVSPMLLASAAGSEWFARLVVPLAKRKQPDPG